MLQLNLTLQHYRLYYKKWLFILTFIKITFNSINVDSKDSVKKKRGNERKQLNIKNC